MANSNDANSRVDEIQRREKVQVIISNPLTRRLVEQVIRADNALRYADQEYGRGNISAERYREIWDEVQNAESALRQRVSTVQREARARPRRRRRSRSGNGDARSQKSGNGSAESSSGTSGERQTGDQSDSEAASSSVPSAARGGSKGTRPSGTAGKASGGTAPPRPGTGS